MRGFFGPLLRFNSLFLHDLYFDNQDPIVPIMR